MFIMVIPQACIVINGQLIAAAEEERFRRIKHWAGFPIEAIKYSIKATPDLLMEGLKEKILNIQEFEIFIRELVVENRLSSVVAELYLMEGKRYVED